MRIAVIGSGYVGLVSAACFAEIGHNVITVDNNASKIAVLENGGVPIHEQYLPGLLAKHHGKNLRYSTSIAESIQDADVIFITVGTPPSATGEADLSFVEAVAAEIAQGLRGKRKVIVEKSTVPVRTCDWLRRSLALNGASPETYSVASNPEFLREGTAVRDFLCPDRIVIGVDDAFSANALQTIYEPLTSGNYYKRSDVVLAETCVGSKAQIIVTNAKSAELIKHASNAFLAMKISFVNAVANVAECVGADINQVCAGVGSDSRIGPRFLSAGIGYGGSCFPKDVQAFQAMADNCGYRFGLLNEVMRINAEQRLRFLNKVRNALWTIRGKRLAALGLAFKGDTDDVRESPAVDIIQSLVAEGACINAFDPAAVGNAKELLPTENILYVNDPYEAATGADALLILTEWKQFASLDLKKIRDLLKYPILIDGRNLYHPREVAKAGLIYYSVGRAVAAPAGMAHYAQHESEKIGPEMSFGHPPGGTYATV